MAASAQSQEVYKYWVLLADKEGSSYTTAEPEEYLSARALERRRRQRIQIDSLDLPVSSLYAEALQAAGFRVQNRSKWLNGVTLFANDSLMASRLDTMPFVVSYQLLAKDSLKAPEMEAAEPTEPLEPATYGEMFDSAYYNYSYAQIEQLNGTGLHRSGHRGEGIIIGVCDGGFPGVDSLAAFDSLRSEGRLLAVRDFVWDGDSVFNVHNHGTLVLSTMAADIAGLYVGTAPKAEYALCRTENTVSETPLEEYNWIAAAEYLDSLGADIITTSLGYFYFDDSLMSHTLEDLDGRTSPMTQAADIAASRGMLVLNAAGNDGDSDPQHINVPADAERVLTVGAADHDGACAYFSSHGPTYDLRIKPDVMALGRAVRCVNQMGAIGIASGTSLACPIMAGMMACLWQQFPDWSPQQLCDSVRSWGSLADRPDMAAGYGIPDFGHAMPPVGIIETGRMAPSIELWPNPARHEVRCKTDKGCLMSILDISGRTLAQRRMPAGENVIDLRGMAAGMYFVRITADDGIAVRRLVVRHAIPAE